MTQAMILLVEDNSSDEELTLRALRKASIDNPVTVARDGAEALDYLFVQGKFSSRDVSENPHVIFLDLNLPKLGGLDVLRAIRSDDRTKHLPVVILTSSKEDRDLERGYAFGANSYIVKPVDFNEFSDAVRQLGRYWVQLNQKPPGSALRA